MELSRWAMLSWTSMMLSSSSPRNDSNSKLWLAARGRANVRRFGCWQRNAGLELKLFGLGHGHGACRLHQGSQVLANALAAVGKGA